MGKVVLNRGNSWKICRIGKFLAMQRNWSIKLLYNPNIDRFISGHGMKIHDIRIQPFLGSDIRWEHTDDGWVISLYPGMYHSGPAEESILHALSLVNRRFNPWFEETPAEEFNRLTKKFLDERRVVYPEVRDDYSRDIVAIDEAICSAFDFYYLLTRGYLNGHEAQGLVDYRSRNFISTRGTVEFLAAMAVLKLMGYNLSEMNDFIIRNKWYDLFHALDRIENCLGNNKVVHSDSIFVFDKLLPHLKEQSFFDTIAVLKRNAIGERDLSEIDFDITISYASEDREVVYPITRGLLSEGLVVCFDEYMQPEWWGKELHKHLTDVYRNRARFCLMIISADYARKLWPTVEKEAAAGRAVRDNLDYILPLRLDDTAVPGLPQSLVYIDIRYRTIEQICDLILKRVRFLK